MKTDEVRLRNRRIVLAIGGVAAVLIAAVIGLSLGEGAAPDQADPTLTSKETFAEARKDAIAEVQKMTEERGFEEGRKAGARQGARAGRRAGESDGGVAIQQQATEAAQAEAASAQSELSSVAAPPPPP